jgi:hypothetical protein
VRHTHWWSTANSLFPPPHGPGPAVQGWADMFTCSPRWPAPWSELSTQPGARHRTRTSSSPSILAATRDAGEGGGGHHVWLPRVHLPKQTTKLAWAWWRWPGQPPLRINLVVLLVNLVIMCYIDAHWIKFCFCSGTWYSSANVFATCIYACHSKLEK